MVSSDPGNVGYGKITGRIVGFVIDSADADANPDWKPAHPTTTVTFTPSPKYLLNTGAAGGAVTIVPSAFTCGVDDDGYLIDAARDSGGNIPPDANTGVYLAATDDPDNNPSGWTYSVRIKGPGIDRHFSISVPEGSTQDISELAPVPDANGTFTVVGPGLDFQWNGAGDKLGVRAEGSTDPWDYSADLTGPKGDTGDPGTKIVTSWPASPDTDVLYVKVAP